MADATGEPASDRERWLADLRDGDDAALWFEGDEEPIRIFPVERDGDHWIERGEPDSWRFATETGRAVGVKKGGDRWHIRPPSAEDRLGALRRRVARFVEQSATPEQVAAAGALLGLAELPPLRPRAHPRDRGGGRCDFAQMEWCARVDEVAPRPVATRWQPAGAACRPVDHDLFGDKSRCETHCGPLKECAALKEREDSR